jgi:PAS domain S-box-containing protein
LIYQNGVGVGVQGTARDITERKRAEELLRIKEQRFRSLIENSSDAIALFSADGAILYASPSTPAVIGFAPEELLRFTLLELVHPEDRRAFAARFATLLENPRMRMNLQARVRHKDGSWRWLEGTFTNLLAEPDIGAIVNNYRDITERRRAEDDLRQQKEMLQKIFDHIPVMIRLAGPEGKVQLVNREYERTTGWTLKEIQNKNLDVFAELYPDQHQRQVILDRIATPKGEWADLKTRVRDGRVIDTSWTNIYLSAGVTLGIGQDISDRKRAEETLRSYSRQLIEAQEAERQHIARELHDQIGQVLTAVRINLQTIGNSCETEESRSLIAQGMGIIDAALEQVRNLSFELRPSLLDDLGLVAALRWYSDQYTQRTGIRTRSVSTLPGGQTRLRKELETACFRIVQEALTNVVRHANAKNVVINLRKLDHKIVLSIKDDGVGFKERAPNGDASAIRLGLRGMRERALAVGGTLEIESAPARGTEIRAYLPTETKGD